MIIAFTSDTHNQTNEKHADMFSLVKHADVLVHCGDATGMGRAEEIKQFSDWFMSLPCEKRIFVPGNHDMMFEEDEARARSLLDPSIVCLINQSIDIDDVRFYGSPHTPTFGQWAFMLSRGEQIAEAWAKITPCDVLITHGPPHMTLDWSIWNMENAGCQELAKRVAAIKPNIHAFGHIHHSYGSLKRHDDSTMYLNAACCDERYKPRNRPLLAEIQTS